MINPQWYGVGRDYKFSPNNSMSTALSLWTQEIARMKQIQGLNTVRLAFSFSQTNGNWHSPYVPQDMDTIISLLGENGFSVVLDLHDWRDMIGFFGSEAWINAWVALSSHYKDNENVLAYELFNEPFKANWVSTITSGGAGVAGSEQVAEALNRCYDAIRAKGDYKTIVYPDPWFWRPTPDQINNPTTMPSYLKRDVVVALHEWQNGTFDINYRIQRMDKWNAVSPIWVGEFGIFNNLPYDSQKAFEVAIIEHAKQLWAGWSFWMHGYTSVAQGWQYFTELAQLVVVPPPPPSSYNLALASQLGGSTEPGVGTYTYQAGTEVTIKANPVEGYKFLHWLFTTPMGEATVIDNPYVFTMPSGDVFTEAVFEALPTPPPTPTGCFIATACGTSNASLATLRRFRDQCLPTGLVHVYYRSSPPLADRIRPHENVKKVFRRLFEWLTFQLRKTLTL